MWVDWKTVFSWYTGHWWYVCIYFTSLLYCICIFVRNKRNNNNYSAAVKSLRSARDLSWDSYESTSCLYSLTTTTTSAIHGELMRQKLPCASEIISLKLSVADVSIALHFLTLKSVPRSVVYRHLCGRIEALRQCTTSRWTRFRYTIQHCPFSIAVIIFL